VLLEATTFIGKNGGTEDEKYASYWI